MKRLYLLLVLIPFVTLTLSAQETKKEGPEFKFDNEVHEFGEIQEGNKVDHKFKFTNVGNKPIIITDVTSSCGCTIPEWPEEPIMPGKESEIKVVYDSKGKYGKFMKRVSIKSNAITPVKLLIINGTVKQS